MKIYDELRKKISVNNEEGFREVNAIYFLYKLRPWSETLFLLNGC